MASELMSPPDLSLLAKLESGEVMHQQKERVEVPYVNKSNTFVITPEEKEASFGTQYSSIYFNRLGKMQSIVKKAAITKWIKGKKPGDKKPALKQNMMMLEEGQDCVIVGTMYKEQKLKPNILDEHHARQKYEAPPPSRSKYHDDTDDLVLEDQTGRVTLSTHPDAVAHLPIHELVTGVVMGVRGTESVDGTFKVIDFVYAGLGDQNPLPAKGEEGNYIALISGLNISSSEQKSMLALDMFTDYVNGQLGGELEQETASRIARVVVAGNLIAAIEDDAEGELDAWQPKAEADTVQAMHELDEVLAHLSSSVNVDIMPGANDASNLAVPQQPLHHCMFPKAAATSALLGVTNPYQFTADGVDFLGTSGQGVDDVYRYSSLADRKKIAENIVQYGHLFPTAPDTLTCFPYKTDDPFVITSCPHVCFNGNQPEYSSSLIEGDKGQKLRVINVPSFETTQTVVLVNTKTLESFPVTFDAFDDAMAAAE